MKKNSTGQFDSKAQKLQRIIELENKKNKSKIPKLLQPADDTLVLDSSDKTDESVFLDTERSVKASNHIQCMGTFIAPTSESILTTKSYKKQSYHVNRSAFQAMHVYERKSDIVADSTEMDVTTPVQVKTKRLRKRRASEDPDTESQNFPSARVTAETEDNQEQKIISTIDQQDERGRDDELGDKQQEEGDEITVTTDGQVKEQEVNSQKNGERDEEEEEQILNFDENRCDVAVPLEIAENVEKIFNNITKLAKQKGNAIRYAEDEDESEISAVSVTKPQSISLEEEPNSLPRNIKYFISYSPANWKCISDGFGWNEEIRRFYNNSWGGENIRVDHILNNMNGDQKLWPIIDEDRRMYCYDRSDGLDKCFNCYSFGHTRDRCPKPRKPLICYMCGESGHLESRCHNACCLRCGSKTTIFSQSCRKCMNWNDRICPICKLRGHIMNDCPDKWRRYHSTIKPNVYPNSNVMYNKRRYCCHCGKRGHLSDECYKAMKEGSEYPMISSEIKSHAKSYENNVSKAPGSPYEIPCRLLYDPNIKINLGIAEKTSHNDVYGRFLRSVGLEHLISNTSDNNSIFDKESTLNDNIELEQPSCSNIQPEQVPEVSEGTNETSFDTSQSSKMPSPLSPSQKTNKTIVDTQEVHIDHGSCNSKYSFSDHFEAPTTSSTANIKSVLLPDFRKENFKETQEDARPMEELSENNMCKSDEEMIIPPKIPDDMPCEVKIYISNEYSAYFQSHTGQEFLNKIMLDNYIKGRLNRTFLGYNLFIYGLPENQEKFQHQLELKFKSLNETRAQHVFSRAAKFLRW